MNALPELARSENQLTVTAVMDAGIITIGLVGEAAMNEMSTMESMLTALHAYVLEHLVVAVVIDFTKLQFMNSSCIKALVTWIDHIQDLEVAKRYRVRFVSNPTILWQRRSLSAIQCFAPELITVEP